MTINTQRIDKLNLNALLLYNYKDIISNSYGLYTKICKSCNSKPYNQDDIYHIFSDKYLLEQRYP